MATAKDIMTDEVATISGSATVAEAVQLMKFKTLHSLVVERRHSADAYGLVTTNDIANKVVAFGKDPKKVKVYEVMTKPVLTLAVDMRTEYAVRLLVRFKLSRALVVDHSRTPVGIVTLRDMVLRHHSDTKRTRTK